MATSSSSAPDSGASPARRAFSQRLVALAIRPAAQPYYHRWAESWLKARGNRSPEATSAYFDALGRSTHLADWQFRQAVHAARILACDILSLPWATAFDWLGLAAQLMYGSGLRVIECMRLRVKDIDFDQGTITVHDGKGGKHRVVPLPKALESHLREHLQTARERHCQDLAAGAGEVHMPEALSRKNPNACREWPWQYLFAAATLCPHPRTGRIARHHLHEASMQRQFKDAVRRADITKPATSHCMRHCFATHLLQSGTDIRTVQNLMGHASVETTMIYLHVMERPGAGAPSPLDIP